jgi:hypothetical protein
VASFPSIRTEGGLFAPDLYDQLLSAELQGQKPTDFGLGARRTLTDDIASAFNDARALWGVFQNRLSRLAEDDVATTVTRDAWVIPFLGLLGYELRYNTKGYTEGDRTFAISHRAGEDDDAPPIHIVGARQELGRVPESGRPRLAPHSLVQEYLNRSDHVWGLVTNGRTLRLLRDTTFVRRQAYVEFDLESMILEQRFQDFAVLFRLVHRTRLPKVRDETEESLIERYYQHSVDQGGRVREHLRDGVEQCIKDLAKGFLDHPKNEELRRRLSPDCVGNERTTALDLYRQLLRLIYRLLFLLVSEDRGLISTDPVYRDHYGVARLRRLLEARAAYTHDDDIWQSLRVLWRAFGKEELSATLRLAPLNGELFAAQALDEATITNADLLTAFWNLAWYREKPSAPQRPVNYGALDVEELGSVYESLLEYHAAVDGVGPRLEFHLVTGSERKTTGSYYTPPQLVNELVHSALDPVIESRLAAAGTRPEAQEKALLSIRVCDPACGSGHFLLAAARRIGKRLAVVRTGEDEPAPERVREAVRDAIRHSIYGVDKNPLAVDLCRVALWLESHTSGKPLTFLDHRIRCGDSLVGVLDLAALAGGIPDKAFAPLEGDDKTAARDAARKNREEAAGARGLFSGGERALGAFTRASHAIDQADDDSPDAVRRKRALYERSRADAVWVKQNDAADLWTAAFFQPLARGALVITSGAVADHLGGASVDPRLYGLAGAISNRQRFFHWPLEFPEAFADGGFDVVLSNPPWDQVQVDDREFFAPRRRDIAEARNMAQRDKLVAELKTEAPQLHVEYVQFARSNDAVKTFIHHAGRFPLTEFGRLNTAPLFAELSRALMRSGGRCGLIVPTGIATDSYTQFFFNDLFRSGDLVSLYDFENRKGIFPAIHKSYKFCLLTLAAGGAKPGVPLPADFVFFAYEAADLRNPDKRFSLTAAEIALLNPNTGNCPIFRSQADAELTKAIYRRVPILWREATDERPEENPWGLRFLLMFMMNTGSHHFKTAEELEAEGYALEGNIFVSPRDRYLPLYEAKMLHQFDHRWATYENEDKARDVTAEEKRDPTFVVQPRYWVREDIVESATPHPADGSPPPAWFLGWRDITNTTNERTTIASALPRVAVGNNLPLLFMSGISGVERLAWVGLGDSFVVDYVARQKVGGTHINYFYLKQFPFIAPSALAAPTSFSGSDAVSEWLLPRVLELVYTAHDLAPLARDCGYVGTPFAWDDERRFEIRCELDAAFFHLYLPATLDGRWKPAQAADGAVRDETEQELAALVAHFSTPRDAVSFILDQFPIVKKKDEAAHGRYRTQERILEIYDAMQAAAASGKPYTTRLHPPPGERRGRNA